jgi:hypothetical protein
MELGAEGLNDPSRPSIIRAVGDPSSSTRDELAFAAMMRGAEGLAAGQDEILVEASGDPLGLVPVVDAARRAWLERGRPPYLRQLPPCLDLSLRPREPGVPLTTAFPPPAPCDECSHALWCPANAVPARGSRAGLRPLRHREPTAAVLAAVRAICAVWGAPENPAIAAWVHEMVALRRGDLSGPAPSFELSLKREGKRLAPLLRVVDLHPPMSPTWPAQAAATRRRGLLRASARGLDQRQGGEGRVARAIDDFMDLIEAHQPELVGEPTGVSYGVETPVHGGPLRTQIYAHVQPGNDATAHALVRAALGWVGVTPAAIARFTGFSDARTVALITHAPLPDDPRRIKIYVRAPLDTRDAASGLEPLARPAWAPSFGLAVLCCDAGDTGWEKWDFPCAAHFQAAAPVFESFCDGMADEDAQRARRIVDGRQFAPWPTWLSVRPNARTIYLNPR